MESLSLMQAGADTVVIREGEKCRGIYKTVSGKVALYHHYGGKDEYLIGILPPQRYFGMSSFLLENKSPYTAVTVTDSSLMWLGERELEAFIRDDPDNAIDMMWHLAKYVETVTMHISLLTEELNATKDEGRNDGLREKLSRYRQAWLDASKEEFDGYGRRRSQYGGIR